jgi:hypothetical protein
MQPLYIHAKSVCMSVTSPATLQAYFKIDGPVVNLPKNVTDITTAATIIQIAVPELKLVMDPLLYLRALPKPQGVPKIIHMTMASKHRLAPHQILSIISWGWYVRVTAATVAC